jgi:hypothetical protein
MRRSACKRSHANSAGAEHLPARAASAGGRGVRLLRSDTKRYSLEAGVLTLARHWLRRNRFNDLAQPVLDRIGKPST